MFVKKVADKSTFRDYIAIIDEMALWDIRPFHFAEAVISDDEEKPYQDSH